MKNQPLPEWWEKHIGFDQQAVIATAVEITDNPDSAKAEFYRQLIKDHLVPFVHRSLDEIVKVAMMAREAQQSVSVPAVP